MPARISLQVNLTEVMDLRDALISSNGGLYQPINLLKNLRSFNKDKEVNQGLLTILTDAPEVVSWGAAQNQGGAFREGCALFP